MIIVNTIGLLLIALIVWWFWLYKPAESKTAGEQLEVLVDKGSYSPARIRIAPNQAASIRFLRRDPSPCAETLLFNDCDISEELPLNRSETIAIPPMPKGEYAFHCQMQMYRGTLVVG